MTESSAAIDASTAPAARTAGRWHYALLLLIVLLGIALRFTLLDRPTLWGDESATWARTAGTFAEMLEGNKADGFVPLHYELYWAMGKFWTLTPWRMRLIPAIAGSLMVPAMYFLSMQLLSPRASLLAALLTATSAFMLNYSRDAKMYMHTWLFMTMHVACLLWWMRGAGATAWWSSLACGVAAVGLHASAWLVLPAEVLIVATWGRPRPLRWLFFALAVAIMAAGPWYYYHNYNTWTERSGGIVPTTSPSWGGEGSWSQSGIGWIDIQTRDKTGPELVRDSATAYLFGYSRAEEDIGSEGRVPIEPWVLNLAWGALAGIIVIAAAGLPHWSPRRDLANDRYCAPWQSLLWLGAWLVIPTYAFFYCRSVAEPASPFDWLRDATSYFSWQLLWMASLCCGLILLSRRSILRISLAWALGAMLIACVAYSISTGGAMWYAVLMQLCYRPWLIGGLLAVGAAISWVSCGDSLASRARRLAGGIAVAVVILGVCEGSWLAWDHLHRVASQASRTVEWHSIWMPRYLAIVYPALIMSLVILIFRLPGRVLKVVAVCGIVAANLAQFSAHIRLDPEPRVDLIAADVVRAENDKTMLVYVGEHFAMGSPGGGTIGDTTGRYYVALNLGQKFPLRICRYGPTNSMVSQLRHFTSIRWVSGELRRSPDVKTLVLWQRQSRQREQEGEIERELGPDWRKVSQTTQIARRHWNWQEMDEIRRLEFQRVAPAAPAAH